MSHLKSRLMILPVICLLGLALAGAALVIAAQDNVTEVGNTTDGRNSIEIIGTVQQNTFNVVFAGYVTHIEGVSDEALFAEGTLPFARGEAAARFTFQGTGEAYARSVLENLTTTAANVTIDFYFSETAPGASFDDLASFIGETLIASQTARFQNVINVQEPNVGVFMMHGTTEQQIAEPFILGDVTYQLGHVGLVGRSENFGQGFRSSEEPLTAHYVVVGNIVAPAVGGTASKAN
ncbi:MAG TPA: hypothetical protein VHL11_08430 [Phototrophicaceae bacterium]|nr:hypothetical protein [Phototrophicaceae bacterium]